MALIPRSPALIPFTNSASGIQSAFPGISAGINYDYFFDRAIVKDTMKKATHKALYRAGSVVMQIGRAHV